MSELSPEEQKTFNDIRHTDEFGNEYWLARELMPVLGYGKRWDYFKGVIERAQLACANVGDTVENHFTVRSKMADIGYGNQRKLDDYRLTRYACYLVALNGNPKIEIIARAQTYFAVQTRRQEVADQRALDWERHYERLENKASESRLGEVALQRDVTPPELGAIRSQGDTALYGRNSADMKRHLKIPMNRAIADFLPTRISMAKTMANNMTVGNVEKNDLRGKHKIGKAHIGSNAFMRKMLLADGLGAPEDAKAEKDIVQVRIALGLSKGSRKAVHPDQTSLLEG